MGMKKVTVGETQKAGPHCSVGAVLISLNQTHVVKVHTVDIEDGRMGVTGPGAVILNYGL